MKKTEIKDIAKGYATKVITSNDYKKTLQEVVAEIEKRFPTNKVEILAALSPAIKNLDTRGDNTVFLEVEKLIAELIDKQLESNSETQNTKDNDNK